MTSLRRRRTEDMQVRNLSPHTQDSYVVSLFARHFSKSPEVLGPEKIRSYQLYLTKKKKPAPTSIIIVIAALRFLYCTGLLLGLALGGLKASSKVTTQIRAL